MQMNDIDLSLICVLLTTANDHLITARKQSSNRIPIQAVYHLDYKCYRSTVLAPLCQPIIFTRN